MIMLNPISIGLSKVIITMMKAITLRDFGTVDNFELNEFYILPVQPDEVTIRIKASAFNPIDYQMRSGQREKELMLGAIMGIEFSGVITDVGALVTGFKIGDEVMACTILKGSNGTYAEFITLPYYELVHKPSNIDFALAASMPVSAITAKESLNRMQAKSGDKIFINGASGGVGRFLIALLIHNDIKDIVVSAGNEQSVAVLKHLGIPAKNIIDYHEDKFVQKVLDANGNNQYDHVVDLVGGRMAEVAAEVLKINGNYVDVTFHGTELMREILFDKAATIVNIAAYSDMDANKHLAVVAALVDKSEINVPEVNIVGDFKLETVKKAHQLMQSNQTQGRKLVMLHN
jgi:NADPH2:quinone reductase